MPGTNMDRTSEDQARRRFLQTAVKCGIGAAPAISLLLSSRGALANVSGVGSGDMGKHPPKQEYIGKTGGTEKGKGGS
jgi:hypothetical protein